MQHQNTVREDSHATIHQGTAASVLAPESQAQDISPFPLVVRRRHGEDGSKQNPVNTSIGDATAQDSSSGRAVSSSMLPQRRVRSTELKQDDHGSKHRLSGEDVAEDEPRANVFPFQERPQTLQNQRHKIASTRLALGKQQKIWRSKRDDMHKIEAQLMRKLANVKNLNVDDVKDFVLEIRQHYHILQEARSTVASEECEYERIESMLVLQEEDLRDIESLEIQGSTAGSVEVSRDEDVPPSSDQDPTESVVSSGNIRRNNSVEARRYLSQKGDVDLMRERLMDLEVHHSQVTDEQADRRDAGLEPGEDLTVFLDNFINEHHALATQLQDAEKILADYKEALQETDDSAHSLFGEEGSEDRDLSKIENRKLADTAELFLTHSDSLDVYKLLDTGSGVSPVDKSIYVNSWMLHHLRQSPGGIARLISQHEKYGLHLRPDDFKRQVIAYWLDDETTHNIDFSRFAADSHGVSMATAGGKTQNSRAAS